jgi:hypothetical protein
MKSLRWGGSCAPAGPGLGLSPRSGAWRSQCLGVQKRYLVAAHLDIVENLRAAQQIVSDLST